MYVCARVEVPVPKNNLAFEPELEGLGVWLFDIFGGCIWPYLRVHMTIHPLNLWAMP